MAAAADFLVEDRSIPKSVVLLVNILPATTVKLICPFILHVISYRLKVIMTIIIALFSLHMVAWSPSIPWRLAGIGMASAGSGFGETVFLSLASFYSSREISGWSSGTGFAAILGSTLYFLLSTIFCLPLNITIALMSVFPTLMFLCYHFVLDLSQMHVGLTTALLASSETATDEESSSVFSKSPTTLSDRLKLVRPLMMPYLLPLFVVYFMEYINVTIMYTILYPLSDTPFKKYEEEYRAYLVMYQIGVFISRSSLSLVPIKHTWILAGLQTFTTALFASDSLLRFIPNIYIALILITWAGLLGGSAYVNTYGSIKKKIEPNHQEFSMAVVGVADCIGIAVAGAVALSLEPALCRLNKLCRDSTLN